MKMFCMWTQQEEINVCVYGVYLFYLFIHGAQVKSPACLKASVD